MGKIIFDSSEASSANSCDASEIQGSPLEFCIVPIVKT